MYLNFRLMTNIWALIYISNLKSFVSILFLEQLSQKSRCNYNLLFFINSILHPGSKSSFVRPPTVTPFPAMRTSTFYSRFYTSYIFCKISVLSQSLMSWINRLHSICKCSIRTEAIKTNISRNRCDNIYAGLCTVELGKEFLLKKE